MTSAIRLTGINKSFGPVHANRDIDLDIKTGTIHGIIGENGAGKSTLMSILYGFYQADSGQIAVNEREVKIKSSSEAIALGIGMVHQHFMLVENFTVLENIVLGAEGGALLAGGIKQARAGLEQIIQDYGLTVDLDAEVGDLSVGHRQRVEILKALYRGAEILILDEPTGVLTPQEADELFRILDSLRDQGKTILLITHKLREIMAATNSVSVMRQGQMVAHRETANTNMDELGELMVGRKVVLTFDRGDQEARGPVLTVDGLHLTDNDGVERLEDLSFTVCAGEIVGIAGVSGNGQSELLDVLSGIQQATGGEIRLNGEDISNLGPGAAHHLRKAGMAHVPEDRHRMGLVTAFSAREGAILGYEDDDAIQRGMLLDWGKITARTEHLMQDFDVRPPIPDLKAANFSGGNQQKLVLAREIDRDPDLLLVGQPTRGVDIGAIEFIHKRLLALRDAGKAILLVSVELDEIMSLADRILVMFDGCIVGEVSRQRANERILGLMMAGVNPKDAEADTAAGGEA